MSLYNANAVCDRSSKFSEMLLSIFLFWGVTKLDRMCKLTNIKIVAPAYSSHKEVKCKYIVFSFLCVEFAQDVHIHHVQITKPYSVPSTLK